MKRAVFGCLAATVYALSTGTAHAYVPRYYAEPEIVSTAVLLTVAAAGLFVFAKKMRK